VAPAFLRRSGQRDAACKSGEGSGHRRFSVIAGAAVAVEEFGNLVAGGRQADDRELRVQTR
jgi:hypothetical protein